MATDEINQLQYDLRQRYAEQLGEIRVAILAARKERRYSDWFELLDSLYIEVCQKLKDPEKKQYNELIIKANKVISENTMAYTNGGSRNDKLYFILRKINLWLNKVMEEKKMFGAKETFDGL